MGQGDEAAQHTSGEDRDPSTALLSHKCGPWRPPAHVTLWQPVPANCDRQEHQKFVWIYNSGRNHRWSSPGWVSHFLFIFLKKFLVPRFRSPSWVFTLCTIFGRMPGFEPELLRLQPRVLPMSYTHPWWATHIPIELTSLMSYTHLQYTLLCAAVRYLR